MKKISQLLLVGAISIATVYANPSAAKHASSSMEDIKFGVILKPHVSYILRKDYAVTSYGGMLVSLPTISPSVDLFGDYGVNSFLGVRVVLGYSGQGTTCIPISGLVPPSLNPNHNSKESKSYLKERLHYLTLGVMPQIYIDSTRQFCFCIGLRVGWLASAEVVQYDNGEKKGVGNLLEENSPLKLERINWGLLSGLNYEANYGLIIGFEANLGLTNALKEGVEKEDFWKTISAGFNLGYDFAKLF